MDSIKLIEKLSNAFGAPGFEDDVVAAAAEYAKDFASLTESSIRNLYIRPRQAGAKRGRPPKNGKPIVMIDAHSDEIGLIVHSVMPNGMLKLHSLGGWVQTSLPSNKVLVKNADGELVRGVITTIPPHFKSEAEQNQIPKIADMILDIGSDSAAQTKEEFKISAGAPMVPDVSFSYDGKTGLMMGKAFDDRLGCACVLEALKQLSKEALDVELVGTLTSQEEVGARGAIVAANAVKPDVAIFIEGSPADDYFAPEYMVQTALKKGPMLRHMDEGMITNPRFQRLALNIAREKGIAVQEAVRKGSFTNAKDVHVWGEGVPCIVIGIPVRYIHTHNSYAALVDYEASVTLVEEIVRKLNRDIIARL